MGVEERINSKLLPSLLGLTQIDKDLRKLATLTVKQGGLGLRDPVERADKNWSASRALCAHLVECLKGEGEGFSHMTHKMVMKEARAHTAGVDKTEAGARLEELCAGVPPEQERKYRRGTKTGNFLTVMPSEVSGTTLSADEFRVGVLLRLGMTPKGLPSLCDGCGAPFTVEHAHKCKKGGLCTSRHNEVRDTHHHLNTLASSASAVLSEPKIFTGREENFVKGAVDGTVKGLHGRNVKVKWGKKGDLLVKNFWGPGTECIFDVCVTDND